MRPATVARRLLVALADASPAFAAPAQPAGGSFARRLLIALSDSSPAFQPAAYAALDHPAAGYSSPLSPEVRSFRWDEAGGDVLESPRDPIAARPPRGPIARRAARPPRGRSQAPLLALAGMVSAVAVFLYFAGTLPFLNASRPGNGPHPPRKTVTATCATGSIQLIGSAFGPIARHAASEYTRLCKNAVITVDYGNGIDSADAVVQLEIARTGHSTRAGSMIAMYDGETTLAEGLTADPVGALIYSVIAHKGAIPGSNISVAGLRKLYTQPAGIPGDVGVSLQSGSATRQAIVALWGGKPALEPVACPAPSGRAVSLASCTEESSTSVLRFVNGTPNAIGYLAVTGSLSGYPHVSEIKIGNAKPTPANVRNGTYGFVTIEHLYTVPHPAALTKDFLSFLADYLKSVPETGFVACSAAPSRLAADC
jgi:ABC-type phosphate transport system substrate-binding protein